MHLYHSSCVDSIKVIKKLTLYIYRIFLTLHQNPVTKQWQEKPLCLGNGGSCRGFFSGHILGFGEDELGKKKATS